LNSQKPFQPQELISRVKKVCWEPKAALRKKLPNQKLDAPVGVGQALFLPPPASGRFARALRNIPASVPSTAKSQGRWLAESACGCVRSAALVAPAVTGPVYAASGPQRPAPSSIDMQKIARGKFSRLELLIKKLQTELQKSSANTIKRLNLHVPPRFAGLDQQY